MLGGRGRRRARRDRRGRGQGLPHSSPPPPAAGHGEELPARVGARSPGPASSKAGSVPEDLSEEEWAMLKRAKAWLVSQPADLLEAWARAESDAQGLEVLAAMSRR